VGQVVGGLGWGFLVWGVEGVLCLFEYKQGRWQAFWGGRCGVSYIFWNIKQARWRSLDTTPMKYRVELNEIEQTGLGDSR